MILETFCNYIIVAHNTEYNTAVAYIRPSGRDFQKDEMAWLEDNIHITYNENGVIGIDSGKLMDKPENAEYNLNKAYAVLESAASKLYDIFHCYY